MSLTWRDQYRTYVGRKITFFLYILVKFLFFLSTYSHW